MRTEPLKKVILIAQRIRILRTRLESILSDEEERKRTDTKPLYAAIDDEFRRLLETIEILELNYEDYEPLQR